MNNYPSRVKFITQQLIYKSSMIKGLNMMDKEVQASVRRLTDYLLQDLDYYQYVESYLATRGFVRCHTNIFEDKN